MRSIAVVVFPGSNCDRDAYHAVADVTGLPVTYHWYAEPLADDYRAVILPGGFSYGDYLRAGALAKFSSAVESLDGFIRKGKPVLGICNGFQILVEAGFLPGALTKNESLRFQCQDVGLEVESTRCAFLRGARKGQPLTMPIAHSEGRYVCDPDTLKSLEDGDQITLRYAGNVNGSLARIAGISNRAGNVMGLMPHPERCVDGLLGSTDGRVVFESLQASL